MKTHNGNVGKITADVGKITIETLENFEIPYDELYFGKPYAHAYIDDLAINAFDDLEKVMGVSSFKIEERDFNSVKSNTLEVITKKSSQTNKLKGEIMWYQNLPMKISDYVPQVISHSGNFSEYTMEKIEGITFQELFLSNNLKDDVFLMLLNILKNLHSHNDCNPETSKLIYANYAEKLRDRNKKYDYSKFDNHKKVFHSITKNLKDYETNGNGVYGLIHGDVVFTNIIVDKFGKLKLIDPRGLLGNTVTNNGDIMYDYAKILQSLIGYDEVMQIKVVSDEYRKNLIDLLFDFISTNYDSKYINYIKTITKSLLYSLIPLHDNDKCFGYYQLISKLDEI
jgi:streptomycin 6-kinase